MTDPLDFTGKVVIVTGGGKGVGIGITTRFLDAGADVIICGRSAPESLPKASGPAPGKEAVFVQADVKDIGQIEKVVQTAVDRFGRLDCLVNNAGGSPNVDAATVSPRFSASILALNLTAPLWFSQAANRVMQEQGEGGCIVNIASVSGTRPSPGTAAYGAAKAGLLNLTQTLAVEWAPRVRVNAVTAGLVKTEQAHMHYGDDAGIAAVEKTIPLGRLAEPTDIGDVCLFLASPLSSYVSGANLFAHGGGEKPAFLDAAKNTKI